jgi:hypothetical protein
MSVLRRASCSLRMSRLGDSDVENQRKKSVTRRLSSYSNARRKSEVAHEDAVNRDIDAAVQKRKDKRQKRKEERRASRSSNGSASASQSDARSRSRSDSEKGDATLASDFNL